MKLYDTVKLNKEIEELAAKGIHKDCMGDIVEIGKKKFLVLFYNNDNVGDYAYAWVETAYLDFIGEHMPELLEEFKEFVSTHHPANKLKFDILKLKEYDFVELIVEKEVYARKGVHRGMRGCITQAYAINGKWNVIFTGEDGVDIAEITVKEEHLKKIN